MVDYTSVLETEKVPSTPSPGFMAEDLSWYDEPDVPKAEDTTRPEPGWGFVDFGQQVLHAGVDILSRFPEFVGTLGSWIDRDADENDLLSTGSRWLDDAGDAMRDWIREVQPVEFKQTDFDTALEAWNEGKEIKPMLRFMRDNSPQALTYLGAAMLFWGIPLGIAETQRILDDRMKNKNKTTADANPADVGAAFAGAAANVFLERLPWMRAARPGVQFKYWKFLGLENATEFGQGAFEDVVTTVGTDKEWSYKESFKQGLAELIGGFGVVAASSPMAASLSAKANARLAAEEEVAAEEEAPPVPPVAPPVTPGVTSREAAEEAAAAEIAGIATADIPAEGTSVIIGAEPDWSDPYAVEFGEEYDKTASVAAATGEPRLTLEEIRAEQDRARREAQGLPPRRILRRSIPDVPPIDKPIPDGTPALDLNTAGEVELALGGVRIGSGRPLSTAQKELLAKHGQDPTAAGWAFVRKAEAKLRADAAKDAETETTRVEKFTLVQAENEASSDFDTFMDDTDSDVTVANDRMVNRARQIRELHGEKIADRYRKTYLKRQKEFEAEQKRRGVGVVPKGIITPDVISPDVGEGTAPPAPPTPDDSTSPPEKRTIGGAAAATVAAGPVTYTNTAGMEITLTELEDGRIQAMADGEAVGATGIFKNIANARKAANKETLELRQARQDVITKREENARLAEEKRIQAAKDKVEADKAAAIAAEEEKKRIAAREKAKRDRMVAESGKIDALEEREDKKEADKAEAKRLADEEERARREAEIEAQAVKEKPTLLAVLKSIYGAPGQSPNAYLAEYNKLSKEGQDELHDKLDKADADADLNAIIKEELESILEFEVGEGEVGVAADVASDELGSPLMDVLRAQAEVDDIDGARETLESIKDEGTKAEIAAANKILAGMTKAADRTVVTPPVRMAGKRAERTKTQAATFAAMKKIPNVTGVSEVLAMDPETFIWKVDNTKAQGGYEMSQLRKIAEDAGIDTKLARPQLAEALKLWYGSQNNPTTTLTAEELKEATGEYTTSEKDKGFLDVQFKGDESRRKGEILRESSQIQSALLSQLNKIFGTEASKNMRELRFINFITLSQARQIRKDYALPDGSIAFVSRADGRTYFIIDAMANANMDVLDVKGTILHEIGVHFGKDILTKTEWTNIKRALLNLYVANDPMVVRAMNTAADRLNFHPLHDIVKYVDKRKIDKLFTQDPRYDDLFDESLAYFATQNPHKIHPKHSLWETIQQGVRDFFHRLLLAFNPRFKGDGANITSQDIVWLISHLTIKAPDLALSRFGDSKRAEKARYAKLDRFLEGSVVKDIQYHGTLEDFSFPVFAVTELGMHFGTIEAAEEAGSHANSYYINLKKPLVINRDLGQWDKIYSWFKHTFEHENSIPDNVSPLGSRRWQSFIEKYKNKADRIAATRGISNEDRLTPRYDEMPEIIELEAEFSTEFKEFWIAQGFDGIQYINNSEDPGSTSYIVFRDRQVSPTSVYSFTPWRKGIGFMDSIGGTEADNVSGNRKAALDAAATVANTHKAIGIGRSTWQSIHRFFDPFATVGARELLLKARYAARGESTIGENMAKNIFDIFEEATDAEKEVIYKYFTTRNASTDMLPDRDVKFKIRETIFRGRRKGGSQMDTVNLKQKTIDVKDQIESLGQEMADLGLIHEFDKRFESLRGKYLPKMYLKYLLGDEYKRALGGGMKPGRLDYTKVRKLHSEWAAKVLLGEIKDPGFLASKYVGTVTHDLAMVNYLNYVVSDPANQGWVLPRGLVNFRGQKRTIFWLEAEATDLMHRADIQEKTDATQAKKMRDLAEEMRAAARKEEPDVAGYDMSKYRRIPDHPKFGGMRGLYVKKEIYDDVEGWAGPTGEQPVVAEIFSRQGWGGVLQRTFKYTRVIANPPTLVRNIGSNTVLLHTSGVSMFKLPYVLGKAMTEILNNGKYYQIAKRHGIETTSFSHEELKGIDREFAKLEKNASLMSKFKLFLSDANVGGRFYQKSEVLFKVAKIIDGMESKGLSEADAALEAQESILDYSLVSPSVRFLRSVPFGAPFITFQVKVLPQLLKNLRKNPLSFAPYVALPYIMAGLFAGSNDVDEEDVKKLRQHMGEWARDRSGIHFLPSKDENGKWVAIDIGYMLPWTAWYETARDMQKMEFGDAWQGAGFFTGPIDILKGFESNLDPFTRQTIWNELDPPQQQYEDMMIFLASYMVPPFMNPRGKAGGVTTGGGPAVKLLMAAGLKDGNIGDDGLPKYTIPSSIMAMFGLNTYTLDPSAQLGKNLKWMTGDLNRTKARMLQLIQDPGISDDKRQQLIDEYVAHIQNKMMEVQEYVESIEGMSEKLQ